MANANKAHVPATVIDPEVTMIWEESYTSVEREGIGRSTYPRSNHRSRGRALINLLYLILSYNSQTAMSTTATISVLAPADFHVHLRQGDLLQLVTPHVREGGFRLAYVMVNIVCENHLVVDLRCLTSQISPRPLPLRIKPWNTRPLSRKSIQKLSS